MITPVLGAQAMRDAEAAVIAGGTPALVLMERAVAAAARAAQAIGLPRDVLVLCGPGNNGGDGYGVAAALLAAGHRVQVVAVLPPATATARAMAGRWHGPMVALDDAASKGAVIDAVFGTGLTRPLAPALQARLAALCTDARLRIALDLPSGVDTDSGRDLGTFLTADLTVAFGALKPAHLLDPARSCCGRVVIADIGLGALAADLTRVAPPAAVLLPNDSNKYRRGAVLVLGGPPGRGGAARLTARAALRGGAGLAMIAVPAAAVAENAARLDAVMVAAADTGSAVAALLAERRYAALAAGPGMGPDPHGRLDALLAARLPVVLDADVFTQFAGDPARLRRALTGPAVLTPHEGEFVRLFGDLPGSKVDRARAAADQVGAVVLLKGSDTVIAAPGGRAAINVHASPALATAGSGDVLAGVVAARLAMGEGAFDAACAAAWLHGDAGRRGGAGLTADDLPELIGARR